jgi:hypothetical protein
MSQPKAPEHQTLSVDDHREANGQGMFPIHSTLILPNFTITYVSLDVTTDRDSSDESDENEPERANSSEDLFSMYQNMTEEDDKQRAKRWLKDADGILVFVRTSVSFIFHTASSIGSILQTGLLTVAVVTLLTLTIPGLKQDPHETSAFYLTQLFQLQLHAYETRSTPFIPDQPPTSSPVIFIIANTFLVISLSLNISAAMLALLLQRWTRQYLMFTHSPHSSSDFRARMREVFSDSHQTSPISSAVWISMNSSLLSVTTFLLALSL